MRIDHLIKAAEESNLKLIERIEIVDLLKELERKNLTFDEAMIALKREP